MILKVGLTGGIGSGKTTAALVFGSMGIPVFFADKEARRLINTNPTLRKQIMALFGKESFKDNIYNTSFISKAVFSDHSLLNKLNCLVHPYVGESFKVWCKKQKNIPYLIMEAAILYESGFHKMFDYIITVSAPEKLRIERISQRDNMSKKSIKARMNTQLSEEQLIASSDFVLINDGNTLLIPQILEIHNKFISLHKK